MTRLTGWRPDPTARHEGRYFVAGRPTNRVRDGRAETTDPLGGALLPDYLYLSPSTSGLRSAWLGTGVATAVIVVAAIVVWGLLRPSHHKPPSPDETYLAALKDAGLAQQFNSDANALAHGRQVCRQLVDGGPQQGLAADKLAVDAFCRQFSSGFHILETVSVTGTFVLMDTTSYTSPIAATGPTCEGTGGYADINRNTQVTVKNGKGEILATTALGDGHSGRGNCTFSFGFPVTEGQERYVISVGRRGEFSYTFSQLQTQRIEIHLGH